MKNCALILICFIGLTTAALAQTKVSAIEIIKQINAGKSVEYANVHIEGDLDLTNLENRRSTRSSNWSFGNESYESTVEVSVKFTDCTFLGGVLAYYNVEHGDATYVAHFEKDVIFKNCVFKLESEFKYSEFNGVAIFTGSTFNEPANFKYAEFSSGPAFNSVLFNDGADFKYTEFPRETSFEKSTFRGLANFKYSKFRSPLNMQGVAFKGNEDFKYTKIDGRDFTSYLLTK